MVGDQQVSAVPLKGPKLEIFGSKAFTQTKPVWVEDFKTTVGQKIQNFDD
jgi:hypothetical protein